MSKTKELFKQHVPTTTMQECMSPEDYLAWLVKNNEPADLQDHLFDMLLSTVRDDRFILNGPEQREDYLNVFKTLSDLITSTQQVYKNDEFGSRL